MATFDKAKYDSAYIKENQRQFLVKVNRKHEPEMVKWLESIGATQTYIKELIRQDMAAHGIKDEPVPENT